MVILKFSQGDPTQNAFATWLAKYGIYLGIGFAVLIACVVVAVLVFNDRSNKSEKEDLSSLPKIYSSVDIYSLLGGKENVIKHDRVNSRIILELKDDSKVESDKLKGIGVDSILKMSGKTILVVKEGADSFYSLFN